MEKITKEELAAMLKIDDDDLDRVIGAAGREYTNCQQKCINYRDVNLSGCLNRYYQNVYTEYQYEECEHEVQNDTIQCFLDCAASE